MHDIVDECSVEHDPRRHVPNGANDVVMTTWHEHEPLEEAVDFLATAAVPSDGYLPDSDFRLVLSVGHPEWGATAKRILETIGFFV